MARPVSASWMTLALTLTRRWHAASLVSNCGHWVFLRHFMDRTANPCSPDPVEALI